jgi:hypothetical protein
MRKTYLDRAELGLRVATAAAAARSFGTGSLERLVNARTRVEMRGR